MHKNTLQQFHEWGEASAPLAHVA